MKKREFQYIPAAIRDNTNTQMVGEKAVMVYRIIELIWLTTRNQLIHTNEQRDE